jgi:rubrerythrin
MIISTNVFAQAPGMMWRWDDNERCPLCGQDWDGGYPYYKAVPDQIDRPKSEKWIKLLTEVLADEELSKKQYETDKNKYNVNMPYHMVIPQEENHILWIKDLFEAYGISPEVKSLPVLKSDNLREAYENAMKLEKDLIPKYERLITNAEDKISRKVLGTILLQTRMHYVMFSHALEMGGMMQMNPMRFKRRAY